MNFELKTVRFLDFSPAESLVKKLTGFFGHIYTTYLASTLNPFLPYIKDILDMITIILIAVIIFVLLKLNKVVKEDNEKYSPIDIEKEEKQKTRIEWEIILEHLSSENQAEWKIAIIEADSILDEILKEVGYVGETLADRLKAAGDGEVIQQAWEAHKVRNMLAHDSGSEITRREAERVILLYENVFKKFGYI